MASEIIAAIVGLFCTVTSGVVTFFLTKKKYNTEVDAQRIQNMGESFDIYKKMMDETVSFQNKRIEALQRENETLKSQINNLQMQIYDLLKGKYESAKYALKVESTNEDPV